MRSEKVKEEVEKGEEQGQIGGVGSRTAEG